MHKKKGIGIGIVIAILTVLVELFGGYLAVYLLGKLKAERR